MTVPEVSSEFITESTTCLAPSDLTSVALLQPGTGQSGGSHSCHVVPPALIGCGDILPIKRG